MSFASIALGEAHGFFENKRCFWQGNRARWRGVSRWSDCASSRVEMLRKIRKAARINCLAMRSLGQGDHPRVDYAASDPTRSWGGAGYTLQRGSTTGGRFLAAEIYLVAHFWQVVRPILGNIQRGCRYLCALNSPPRWRCSP